MKRSGGLARKGYIKRSRSPSSKIPPEVRAEVERRSGGYCEVAAVPNCQRHANQLHHRLPRSAGGLHTVTNLLNTCSTCHGFLHDHPEEAYQRSWLIRRS